MLPVARNLHDSAFDACPTALQLLHLSHTVFAFIDQESLNRAVLEENSDTETIFVGDFMAEHINDFLFEDVSIGAVQTDTATAILHVIAISEAVMALPDLQFCVVVRENVPVGHQHERLVQDEVLERLDQVSVLLVLEKRALVLFKIGEENDAAKAGALLLRQVEEDFMVAICGRGVLGDLINIKSEAAGEHCGVEIHVHVRVLVHSVLLVLVRRRHPLAIEVEVQIARLTNDYSGLLLAFEAHVPVVLDLVLRLYRESSPVLSSWLPLFLVDELFLLDKLHVQLGGVSLVHCDLDLVEV